MFTRFIAVCVLLFTGLNTVLCQDQSDVSGDCLVLKNAAIALHFDSKTGQLLSITGQDKALCNEPPITQGFDFMQDGQWQFGKRPVRLKALTQQENTVSVQLALNEWELELCYELDLVLPRVTCHAAIVWNGDGDSAETRLKNLWFDLPAMVTESESEFFIPGVWPPARHYLAEVPLQSSFSAHGVTPSIIIQKNEKCSFLLLGNDGTDRSDYMSLSVNKAAEDRLRPRVVFNIQARMKPGERQEVGDAVLQIMENNAETTLLKIHEVFASLGHTVPADRPEWFKNSLLYCFHPGGTIGSDCKDLGGFQNAKILVDRVARMNMNTVWIMPLEDYGIYWPRDYYQFQQGLGSGDDYRELVQRIHGNGLRVLQDCVPHGGSDKYPRAKEHPDWLIRDEQGNTFNYWCFDFNHPSWRAYMRDVARYYMQEYDLDGFRVDAVMGSKMANWSEPLPYTRASYALRQGGLNMLRDIRSGIEELKPGKVGLLAETSGSAYGTVSDAIYDFDLCYSIFPQLATQTPGDFVNDLRRWLHECQYKEAADLLRLRYVESHDSLRSQPIYGIRADRALVALTTLIHGIPLIYHEQDSGNFDVYATLFKVHHLLPELQGGAADYLGVSVPDGVFAVRRYTSITDSLTGKTADNTDKTTKNESIALINFNEKAVSFDLDVQNTSIVTDLFRNQKIVPRNQTIPVTLAPLEYTVFALRELPTDSVLQNNVNSSSVENTQFCNNANSDEPVSVQEDSIALAAGRCQAWLDSKTGLLLRFDLDGTTLWENATLQLPQELLDSTQKINIQCEPDKNPETVVVTRSFGQYELVLTYRCADSHLLLDAMWTGPVPQNARINIGAHHAIKWQALTADGLLADECMKRLPGSGTGTHGIYYRPQGTEVLYDSLFYPLDSWSGKNGTLAFHTAENLSCVMQFDSFPLRIQWLGCLPESDRLTASLAWSDNDSPANPVSHWAIRLGDSASHDESVPPVNTASNPTAADSTKAESTKNEFGTLVPVACGWQYENDFYRLRLLRNGAIHSLVQKNANGEKLMLDSWELYSDYGFGAPQLRYTNKADVESVVRIVREDDGIKLCFDGRLRGFGRFELPPNPVLYRFEYSLRNAPSFDLHCCTTAGVNDSDEKAFLAFLGRVPELASWSFEKDGSRFANASLTDSALTADSKDPVQRLGETRTGTTPDRIVLSTTGQATLVFDSLRGTLPANLFMLGNQIFFVQCDGTSPRENRTSDWSMSIHVQ